MDQEVADKCYERVMRRDDTGVAFFSNLQEKIVREHSGWKVLHHQTLLR
jgi:hypothetical protein